MDTEFEELYKRFEDATLAWRQDQKPQASPKPASLSSAKLRRLLAAGGKITGIRLKSRSLVVVEDSSMSQKEITREQAAAIAANNLWWREEVRGFQIGSVVRLDEIKGRHPNPYGPSNQDLHDA